MIFAAPSTIPVDITMEQLSTQTFSDALILVDTGHCDLVSSNSPYVVLEKERIYLNGNTKVPFTVMIPTNVTSFKTSITVCPCKEKIGDIKVKACMNKIVTIRVTKDGVETPFVADLKGVRDPVIPSEENIDSVVEKPLVPPHAGEPIPESFTITEVVDEPILIDDIEKVSFDWLTYSGIGLILATGIAGTYYYRKKKKQEKEELISNLGDFNE